MQTNPNVISKKELLADYGENDRLVREAERKQITSLSRTRTTQLEKEGKHPPRKLLELDLI